MGEVDKITESQEAQENKKEKDHEEKLRKRRHRSQIEKNALMEKVELASRSDEEELPQGPRTLPCWIELD